jgi:hypothetical protein
MDIFSVSSKSALQNFRQVGDDSRKTRLFTFHVYFQVCEDLLQARCGCEDVAGAHIFFPQQSNCQLLWSWVPLLWPLCPDDLAVIVPGDCQLTCTLGHYLSAYDLLAELNHGICENVSLSH